MSYSFLDFIGNLGVLFIIIGYFMLQINKIKSSSLLYSSVNLIGALLIIFSLIKDFNLSAFVIEIFWVGISTIGIIRYFMFKGLSGNK